MLETMCQWDIFDWGGAVAITALAAAFLVAVVVAIVNVAREYRRPGKAVLVILKNTAVVAGVVIAVVAGALIVFGGIGWLFRTIFHWLACQ